MQKISTKQLCFLIILGFSLTKFNVLPALVSGAVNEGLWLSCTINFIIDFFILLLVLNIITKYKGLSFYEILKVNFGKTLTKIIALSYALFFMLKALILIVEQKNSIELTFYETQPTFITFMPFFIIAFFILLKGTNAFARGVEVCFFLGILGLSVIILLSVSAGNYTYLLPLFKQSPTKIISGSISALIWFGDPVYLLLFGGQICQTKNFKRSILLSYLITFLLTITLLVIFYAIFDSIAPRQYYAPLKMSKYSISLSNIGRFDYLAEFLLAIFNVYLVVLPLLFCSNLLKEVFSLKNTHIPASMTIVFALAFSILLQHDFLRFINFSKTYLIGFFIAFYYLFPILLYLKGGRKKQNV